MLETMPLHVSRVSGHLSHSTYDAKGTREPAHLRGLPNRLRAATVLIALKWEAAKKGAKREARTVTDVIVSSLAKTEISRGIAAGESARRIAGRLGRSPSTISREIKRNGGREHYWAIVADQETRQRTRRPKPAELALLPGLWAVVEEKLAPSRSPEQISG
ncbi:transposase [Streptomyces sp. NPDC001678]|uniref:transposase n=1 Tax=Streptomyces sp. NPDC001678 TaxID=3364599 RepID=UPI0036740DF3